MRRYSFALDLIKNVSSFLLEERRKGFSIEKKDANDYVTDDDRASERMIRESILKSFPGDEILGEEYGITGTSDSLWVVDPIDGTVDYMNGFPFYTISIAYMEKGEAVFGLVSVPEQGEIFSAIKGEGAFLNGEKITVSSIERKEGLAILVPPHRRHEYLDSYISSMRRLYEVYSDMRSLGSAAISLSYLASGRVSCYYERFLHIYDVAAGLLIAAEAGAEIETVEREGYIDVLATSKGLLKVTKEAIDG